MGKATYETELRDLVVSAFPTSPPRTVDGVTTPGFTQQQQRLCVANVRMAYSEALEYLSDQVAKKEEITSSDLDRPLSAETVDMLDGDLGKECGLGVLA